MTTPAERIAALEDALASGVLTIESEGERLTYRSVADIHAAIRYNQRLLEAPDRSRPASTIAVYDPR